MKQATFAIALVLAGVFCPACAINAQIAAFASVESKHQSNSYQASSAHVDHGDGQIHTTETNTQAKDALYDNYESEIEALPAVRFFPTTGSDMETGTGSKPFILYGLLGVLLLGLATQRMGSQNSRDKHS